MPLIDEIMPSYHRREVHRRTAGTASASALWEAIHELRAEEMKLMRALMSVRTLGRRQTGPGGTVLAGFRGMGFRPVAEDPDREIVVAGIGRFWQPSGGLRKVEGRGQFTEFAEPGYAKVAFNFLIADGEISTETRIAGTDAHAQRRFGLYWLLVRPGSGLIRREWLRALVKRAELTASGSPAPT